MTTYLLDTHTAIWALSDNDKKMSIKAKDAIADRTKDLAISIASAWELAIKISEGSTVFDISKVEIFINKLRENGVQIFGITEDEVKIVETLPFIHNDPFDRIIIATAKCNNMTFISADENIHKYDVKWIW